RSWGLVSITGNVRDNNEDRGLADDQGRFFLVADGMGGQAAGEKASELAVTRIASRLSKELNFASDPADKVRQCIDDAIGEANVEIMALGEVDPQYAKMGTTIVFLVKVSDKFYVGGIGDSRAYRLRNGKLEQLTTDHSLTQALVDAGTITPEEALTHRYRNVLYRYLGTKEGGTGAEAKEIALEKNDRFLLCSDGVLDGLSTDAMIELMKKHTDPQRAADAIVNAALDGGSKDNITCLIVDVDGV
ncbi:MAG: PP2C family serine/threonine-protein phosphatase, partial [Planctomycetaceae bacterium]